MKLREENDRLRIENSNLRETNKEIRNLADDKDNYIVSLEDSKRTFMHEMEKMLTDKDVRRCTHYLSFYVTVCTCTCALYMYGTNW